MLAMWQWEKVQTKPQKVGENTSNEWCEEVLDEDYNKLI